MSCHAFLIIWLFASLVIGLLTAILNRKSNGGTYRVVPLQTGKDRFLDSCKDNTCQMRCTIMAEYKWDERIGCVCV